MNIHFICRGNVLRSLIAETYVKSLGLSHIQAVSSGTNVDWTDPRERQYLANTLQLLDRQGIASFAKTKPDQLTQDRLDQCHNIVIFMNQRVIDEAVELVELPSSYSNWSIVDIGEGNRTDTAHRELYEEDIYQEIVQRVDELLSKYT